MAGRGELKVMPLCGGVSVSYREYGHPQGDPLLFVHGWPGCSAQAQSLHGPAGERNLRVISVDRPGMGRTSRMGESGFLHLPPLLDELMERLGCRDWYVMGVSGGGPYALAAAWALPYRVRAALVCCGAPPLENAEARRRFSPAYRALLGINDVAPSVLRWMLVPVVWAARIRPPWPVMKLLCSVLGKRDRMALGERGRFDLFYPSFAGAMKAGAGAVYRDGQPYTQPWPFAVDEIRVPVRVWHGSQDTNFHHSLAQKLAARIPGAVFHLREEGHYSLPAFRAEEMLDDLMACRAPA